MTRPFLAFLHSTLDSTRLVRHGLILVLAAVSSSGCSVRQLAIGQVTEMVEAGIPAFEEDDELDLVEKSIPANIKLLEALLVSDPTNERLMTLLARLYGSYAFAFVDGRYELAAARNDPAKDELKARMNTYYKRGMEYATRALVFKKPVCAAELKKAETAGNCFNRLSRDELAALFWLAFNKAAYVNRNLSDLKALADASVIEKAMQRVIAIDEGFFFGSANFFLMVYYGGRPKMAGGDVVKAEEYFKRGKRIAGDSFLLGDLLFARFVLVQKQDRSSFHQILTRVASDKSEAGGGFRLYNQMARTRARIYLTQETDLFD